MQLIEPSDTAVVFYDLDKIEDKLSQLRSAFPESTRHAIAIKALPLVAILKKIAQSGFSAEVASWEEFQLAQAAGFSPSHIIYDGPAKTVEELNLAMQSRAHINCDSFEEVNRIAKLRQTQDCLATIGLRINPQVGAGDIESTSVATEQSKFGIPLLNNQEAILAAFQEHSWLKGLHVHIGSQGCSITLMCEAIKKVFELAEWLNEQLATQQLSILDIGGGLPVQYQSQDPLISMGDYVQALQEYIPELFTEKYQLLTEFGRWVLANAGWTLSRVEYLKSHLNKHIAISHMGADMFIRPCYHPDQWHHEISVLDPNFKLKTENVKSYDIAGPLCFSGDFIARNRPLPEIVAGDYLCIQDTGAYTLSMWSRYNNRFVPKVIGYDTNGCSILKNRETFAELWQFWGGNLS